MEVDVSLHALRRYRQRIGPCGLSDPELIDRIRLIVKGADLVPQENGQLRAIIPGFTFVIDPERRRVVTVLYGPRVVST